MNVVRLVWLVLLAGLVALVAAFCPAWLATLYALVVLFAVAIVVVIP